MRALTLLGLLAAAGSASAFSFYGTWGFSYNGVTDVYFNQAFGGSSQTISSSANGDLIDVSQSAESAFLFHYAILGMDGFGDFSVAGNTVTDVNQARTSGSVPAGPFTIRFVVPEFMVTGTVTSTGGFDGAFGPWATNVTGDSMMIMDMNVEALVSGNWVPAGTADTHLGTWSMSRPVPEPASILCLAMGLGAVIRRRRK